MCISIFRWRDFGLLWAFVIFNAVAAVAIYYIARVVRHFVPSVRSPSLFANTRFLSHSLRTLEKSKRQNLSKGRRVRCLGPQISGAGDRNHRKEEREFGK